MKYKVLGRTGVQVSTLCMGTMTFGREADEAACGLMYRRCREIGINFFDCANLYAEGRSEEILGRLIRSERDQVIITSKFFSKTGPDLNARGGSRRHLVQAIEASLRRLQTDRIDIYFLHNIDPLTPLDETLRALDDLVHQGKILYPGISNAAAWQVMKALGISAKEGLARFECIEPMYSLLKRQAEVEILPMAQSEQLGVITYSPLAAGLLAGKYRGGARPAESRIAKSKCYEARYGDPEYYAEADRFVEYCEKRKLAPAAVAMAWVGSHPAVNAPIVGARSRAQLDAALASLQVEMSPEMRAEISALSRTPPLANDRRDEQLGLWIH